MEGVSRLVVDGNNVMGARPDGWWRDRAAAGRRLVDDLGRFVATHDVPVTVVFDGPVVEDGRAQPPGVEVRIAPRQGRDAADDVIAALVATSPDPSTLLVVTADRALRDRVTASGAGVTGPRSLLEALSGEA